jgi:ADP-heptose:LPS heptosyltransferase
MHMAATLDKPLIAVFNRLEDVKKVLQESEADRAARLEQIHALTAMLKESEADRAARFDQILELTRLLSEETRLLSEEKGRADDAEQGWRDLEGAFAVRQARRVGLIKTRRI